MKNHAEEVLARIARDKRENDLQLLLAVTILLVMLLLACVPLPLTTFPVCSEHRGIVCRAPSKPYVWRDPRWEHLHVCPEKTDLTLRACYRFAGVFDGRQLYVYQSPDADDNP